MLILDTETTGFEKHPIHGHPQVIELAQLFIPSVDSLRHLHNALIRESISSCRFKPSMDINPNAIKVHGIQLKDLKNCVPSEQVTDFLTKNPFTIGHNVAYDLRCLNYSHTNPICTVKLLKKLQKLEKYPPGSTKLGDAFEYFSEGTDNMSYISEKKFHSAGDDVFKTACILREILNVFKEINTPKALYDLQNL